MEENKETTTEETPNFWGNAVSLPEQETVTQEPVQTEQVTETITETITETVQDKPIEKLEPIIQEKIVEVEKIIEKDLQFPDEYSRSLYEAISTGNDDAIYKYYQDKNIDYNSMSDIDAVKSRLQKENPSWTSKDIDAEMKFKYGKSLEYKELEDLDEDSKEYELAVQHNENVDRSLNLLERDSRDSRAYLNEQKKTIELPKIKNEAVVETQKQLSAEEIEVINKQWESSVDAEIPKLSDLSFKVGDEEVTYKATDDEKAEFTSLMKTFNDVDYLTKRGWYDEQGRINILTVAEDVRKLEKIDKIISSVSTQLKTSAKKDVIAEIKNLDFSKGNQSAELNSDLAASIWN